MNYEETLEWMFRQLPMYQRQGKSAFKKDLTNIRLFCQYLENPQEKFKSIHVGGTNGKGSTSTMIAHVLKENNYKTGLYTSPHLIDFRERIQIDFDKISRQFVVDFIHEHQQFLAKHQLSFFEMSVGMAFEHFAQQRVDFAVVEVGLGGRLDSTNILDPEIAVITNIGYDHMDMLGETLAEIAYEKAGIIKPNTPIVIGEKQAETQDEFEEKAEAVDADLHYADADLIIKQIQDSLIPDYQIKNIATAEKALSILADTGRINIKDPLQILLEQIVQKGIYGKFMRLSTNPFILLDAAHNQPALSALAKEIDRLSFDKCFIVFGSVKGKDVSGLLKLLPQDAYYYFCQPSVPRGLPVSELVSAARSSGLNFKSFNHPATAYRRAVEDMTASDLLLVTGSTFVLADLLALPEIKNKLV